MSVYFLPKSILCVYIWLRCVRLCVCVFVCMSAHVCVETRAFSTVVYLWRQSLSLDPEIADSAKLAAWWACPSQPRLHQGSKCFRVWFWECKFSSSSLCVCLSPHSDQLCFLLFCLTCLCKQIYFHYFRLFACLCVCVGTCAQKQMQALCGSEGSVPPGTWVSGCCELLTPMRRSELRSSAKGTSLCRFGCLWTHWALPTSATQVMKWKERLEPPLLVYFIRFKFKLPWSCSEKT